MSEPRWRLVLPVKGGGQAKSRLRPITTTSPDLATALALDCLDAVLACSRVVGAWVVSADDRLAGLVMARGGHAVGESLPGAGLLAAIADGLAVVSAEAATGEGSGPVAVLLADVPCLLPNDLAAALEQADAALAAGAAQVLVPDAEGTGTVLLAAASPGALVPRFGPGSAAAHRNDGAVVVGRGLRRLRRDVDTPAELDDALALGVGPHTRAALGQSLRLGQGRLPA